MILASFLLGIISTVGPLQAAYSNPVVSSSKNLSLIPRKPYLGVELTIMVPTQSSDEMLEDSNFWVNYLKKKVQPELEEVETPSILDEMDQNPTYWVDYLKKVTAEE